MHVDRSRFLFLTASLAAAACNQPQPAASPDTGTADPAGSNNQAESGATSSVWLEIEPGTEDHEREVDTGTCDNRVGNPAPCSLSAPGSHCESFDSTIRMCRSFAEFMQPRPAEAAVDCMLAASGTQRICSWEIGQECAGAGMQAVCVDPAMRSRCDSISAMCGGSVDTFSCQQAMSAVRPQRLDRLASCIQEFCEVPFCVTDLGMF